MNLPVPDVYAVQPDTLPTATKWVGAQGRRIVGSRMNTWSVDTDWQPEPLPRMDKKIRRQTVIGWGVMALLTLAVLVGAIAASGADKKDVATPGTAGARIVEDNGLGIGYGIKVDSDWKCGVVGATTFACIGTSGLAHVSSGSRSQYDIAARVADMDVAVRYDASRWRCDASLSAVPGGRRGFTCDQRR